MKNPVLRRYVTEKTLTLPHVLKDCDLVIDAASFFKDTYRSSGLQYILGTDCDRYADLIVSKLSSFLHSKIKCHVIFNGATKHELDKRKEIRQDIIDNLIYKENLNNVTYFEPLFIKEVEKQVLEEMDIKYFMCEYDSIEAIVGVARKFKCPVLTNNIEYTVYGISCIPLNSLEYDKTNKQIKCQIYEHDAVKTVFGVYGKMPLLLTLLNDNGRYLEELTKILPLVQSDLILPVIRWVKRQREASILDTVSQMIYDVDQNKAFIQNYEKNQTLYLYPSCHLAVKYFQRDKQHGLFRNDKKWFAKGVANGRIALPYVNLKKKGIIGGSLIVNDSNRPDALLAAIDIIIYSHCILSNSQDSTITLIERKHNSLSIRDIVTHWDEEISNRDIFSKTSVEKKRKLIMDETDSFQKFLKNRLNGYDSKQALVVVPENCLILVFSLVYYIAKKNNNFINAAYCVLLSYVILGPASKKIDELKKCGMSNNEKDCTIFYNGLQFLFNGVGVKENINSSIVHDFSEFQHCLQYMNYLNKLCGERIPCTVYHDTFNATFIYNTFLFMKDKNNLMNFLGNEFIGSHYLNLYKNIVNAFEKCLSAVKAFESE